MKLTKRIIATVLLLAVFIVGGCAPKQAPPPPPAPATALINIVNGENALGLGTNYGGEFRPHDVVISVGGTVTWNNTDIVHGTQDVISNDGLFNKSLGYGESFNYTFTQNGTFRYYNDLHDNMDGTVVVR